MKFKKESASPGYRAEVAKELAELIGQLPGIQAGKMFGFPAFYAAGKLFACVYGKGAGLKLPAGDVAALLKQPGFAPFQPYGKPKMREWIEIRRPAAADYRGDLALFMKSVEFVSQKGRDRHSQGRNSRQVKGSGVKSKPQRAKGATGASPPKIGN